MTLDEIFESFRRASVSSFQMQQELMKQWTQQWPSAPLNAAGVSTEWVQKLQKRWLEFVTESLNRQREAVDSMFRAVIQLVEQSARLSESKSPEEYRHTAEEIRQKAFEVFKERSEAQLRDFQKATEKWLDIIPRA